MKVIFYIGIDDSSQEETIELPDDYSNEQIEEEFDEWKADHLDTTWYKIEE